MTDSGSGAPGCRVCGAGSVYSFDWESAQAGSLPRQLRRDVSAYVGPVPLRHGTLYECRACGRPWYLYGEPASMNMVPRARLELVRRWNEREIALPAREAARLAQIGRTPPDIYGNGRQFHETPCTIITTQGEQLDLAVVSIQRHAPFEEHRAYRLATEIAEIRPSPHALPLPLRVATSRAEEAAMGFAPTLVELPNGETVALSWRQHFLVVPGIDASAVVLSPRSFDRDHAPPVYRAPPGITYFVADRAPGLA